jgi:TolB-like protein/Tfp pilus assembly protein PilF
MNVAERRLLRDGLPVSLPPKVFDTLVVLIENSGHLVDRDGLMSKLWPDTFVEEATVARNISDLRKALGESSGEGKYIETVAKAGYRFVADVRKISEGDTMLIVRRRTRSRMTVEETGSRGEFQSIAVLPFRLLAGDSGDDYLGLGVADALITRLSKIQRIMVRPTSSTVRYAGANCNPVAAGKELQVDSVLEGSIQRIDDRIRVTVQLVSVDDGASLWAEKFDEMFTDIFTVEDSISEQVAQALALELTIDERNLLKKRYTDNTDAYQFYLKGRYYWNKRTPEWLKKGFECFKQAIENDRSYASAYAGLSDSYTLLVVHNAIAPDDGFRKAKEAAEVALKLDESLGEAHASLAHAMLHNWEWDDSLQGFKRAIELNPNYASAHHWYSEYLLATGQLEAAIAAIKKALQLDPLSLIMSAHLSDVLYFGRDYDESAAVCERVLEMDPGFFLARINLARAHGQLGRYEQGLSEAEEAGRLVAGSLEVSWVTGQIYAAWGKKEAARAILDSLIAISHERYVSPCGIAMIYATLGEPDEAFEWLEKAYQSHDSEAFNLKVEPRLDSLRADGRYRNLLQRVGLEV